MCGIVGLFAKSSEVEAQLGRHLAAMLVQLSDRGPDSAGVAIYDDPAPEGSSKLTLCSHDPLENWGAVRDSLEEMSGACAPPRARSNHPVFVLPAETSDAEGWVSGSRPALRVMSAGRS